MNKLCYIFIAYVLTAGCTSYKKAVTAHAVIDDKIERDKLISGRNEVDVDTSVWQNKKIIVTDIEFYPAKEAGRQLKADLPIPIKDAPVKRVHHVVIESLQEEQATSKTVSSSEAIEVSKVEIKEQEDIKEDKRPAGGLGSVYIFGLGVFLGLLILLFLRKLFRR